MERNTRGRKEKAALTKKEGVQISIEDNYTAKGACGKLQQLDPQRSKKQKKSGQAGQYNAQSLSPFEVQVMRGFLALKNKACPWNSATENVRTYHRTECPPFQMRPMKSFV